MFHSCLYHVILARRIPNENKRSVLLWCPKRSWTSNRLCFGNTQSNHWPSNSTRSNRFARRRCWSGNNSRWSWDCCTRFIYRWAFSSTWSWHFGRHRLGWVATNRHIRGWPSDNVWWTSFRICSISKSRGCRRHWSRPITTPTGRPEIRGKHTANASSHDRSTDTSKLTRWYLNRYNSDWPLQDVLSLGFIFAKMTYVQP